MLYPIIAKKLIYPAFQVYMREGNTLEYLKDLERSQWYSIQEIDALQWKKLKALLNYSYHNVPYYRKIFEQLGLTPDNIKCYSDISKLPLLDKETIRREFKNITSLRYTEKDLVQNSTGGSSGVMLNFLGDKKKGGIIRAFVIRNERWAGLDIGDKRASLWGSPIDISSQDALKLKVYNKLNRILFLPSYNLSDERMGYFASKLSQYKPKVMVGYASSLYIFSQFLKRHDIHSINTNSVISSAEVLYDYQREAIEDAFDCKVFDRYGCREVSTIAHECSEHFGMHINSEHIFIETIGKDGESRAPGERGELVITDLDNYGMPLIRYRIGDAGVLSNERCNCGRGLPILEKLEGRVYDVIIGANGKIFDGHFFSIVIRTVKGIMQYQIIQNDINKLKIKLVVNNEFRPEYIQILSQKIADVCGKEFMVDFEIVDHIEILKSGKYRFVVSNPELLKYK